MATESQWPGAQSRPGNPSTGAASGTSGASGGSGSGMSDTANAVKERAGAMLDDAKETARSRLNEQKDEAAGGIDDVAGALRDASRRRDGANDPVGQLTGAAADGLERLSSTLRNKDVGGMLRDIESFARSQPVAFFGLSLAAGFLAVRFLKASDSHASAAGDSRWPSGSDSRYGAGTSRLGTTSSYQEDPWTTR